MLETLISLAYTDFILVWLYIKLIETLESVPGTIQYCAMSVNYLAQGNNALPLNWTHAVSDSDMLTNNNQMLIFNLLNFSNGIIHLPFWNCLLSFLRYIKLTTWSLKANSIEPGQAAWMYRLAWFYTGDKDMTFGSSMIRLKPEVNKTNK